MARKPKTATPGMDAAGEAMKLGIEGRVAIVLGAGGGLGGAIALSLAQEGAIVIACDIDPSGIERTVHEANALRLHINPVVIDIADLAKVEELVDDVRRDHGPIAILINNTGGPPPTSAEGVSTDTWVRYFTTMVLPIFRLTDLVLPGMRDLKWGRIITSTSSGVVAPIPNLAISNALRSTLVGWSKTLAGEVGRDGITANIILPGRVATARIVKLDEARARREGRTVEEVRAESVATIPVGRYGRPTEYGDVVAFLASDRAAYINGSVVRVDGGMIPST